MTQQASSYPVDLDIPYPDQLSRGHLLLRLFFGGLYIGLSHGIILSFLFIAAGVVMVIAFFAVLFTGRYPRGLFDFVVGVLRWNARVSAYMFLLRDEFPPFRMDP